MVWNSRKESDCSRRYQVSQHTDNRAIFAFFGVDCIFSGFLTVVSLFGYWTQTPRHIVVQIIFLQIHHCKRACCLAVSYALSHKLVNKFDSYNYYTLYSYNICNLCLSESNFLKMPCTNRQLVFHAKEKNQTLYWLQLIKFNESGSDYNFLRKQNEEMKCSPTYRPFSCINLIDEDILQNKCINLVNNQEFKV